jgi:hypothetical protein
MILDEKKEKAMRIGLPLSSFVETFGQLLRYCAQLFCVETSQTQQDQHVFVSRIR